MRVHEKIVTPGTASEPPREEAAASEATAAPTASERSEASILACDITHARGKPLSFSDAAPRRSATALADPAKLREPAVRGGIPGTLCSSADGAPAVTLPNPSFLTSSLSGIYHRTNGLVRWRPLISLTCTSIFVPRNSLEDVPAP